MPMTHIPEIGAEKPCQQTGTTNWYENRACPICFQKLVPEKFGTKLHVKCLTKQYRFSGMGFHSTKLHVKCVRNQYRFSGMGFYC